MYTVEKVKALGKVRTPESFDTLLEIFRSNAEIDVRREAVSSIGRHNDSGRIYDFLRAEAFNRENPMELVYQMFRTCLYRSKDDARFAELRREMLDFWHNEILDKMNAYYNYRQKREKSRPVSKITTPLLLIGDNTETMKTLPANSIQLIFTSPPYYNAREYSNYSSYSEYLAKMGKVFRECNRVLEDGRFMIVNVSPVITRRPGREFESIRYPIHYDFHITSTLRLSTIRITLLFSQKNCAGKCCVITRLRAMWLWILLPVQGHSVGQRGIWEESLCFARLTRITRILSRMKAVDIMTFGEEAVRNTVKKLLSGNDYRDEVINAVNAVFFDFCIKFFGQIVIAKLNGNNINMSWYSENFIEAYDITPEDAVIYSGLNKKTITNMYGSSTREVMLDAARNNFEYLRSLLSELEKDAENDLAVTISISRNDVIVKLSLTESLLVINALATKKLQIRGGAWSAIGKRVEKPLVDELCRLAGVPEENIDRKTFKRDKSLPYDRETDYRLISFTGKIYRVEVKLMGRGNPESADTTIARDTDIFIADTLSEQSRAQLTERGTKYLVLRDNNKILPDFIKILDKLEIPHA